MKTKPSFPSCLCSPLRRAEDQKKIFTEEDTQTLLGGENRLHCEMMQRKGRLRIVFTVYHIELLFFFPMNSYHSMTEFNLFLCFCFHIIIECCSIICSANICKIRVSLFDTKTQITKHTSTLAKVS